VCFYGTCDVCERREDALRLKIIPSPVYISLPRIVAYNSFRFEDYVADFTRFLKHQLSVVFLC